MITEAKWNQLIEDHEVTLLRADVCLGSPESFTLDEKRRICEDMDASTAEVEAAMRDDFAAMSPTAQDAMLDLLCADDPSQRSWWIELLTGFRVPDAAPEPPEVSGREQSTGAARPVL